jgi:hypothetical protein
MPLTLTLASPERRWAEQLHVVTLTRVTTLGYENSWAPTLVWAFLYVAAALAISRRFVSALPLPVVTVFSALLVLVATSAAWSHYPAKALMNAAHFAGSGLIAIAAATRYRSDPGTAVRHVSYVLGVNVTVHLCGVVVAPHLTSDWTGRWVGLTQHANVLGAIAFAAVWANVVASILFAKSRLLNAAFASVALATLLGTESMTSIVATCVAVGATLLLVLGRWLNVRRARLLAPLPILGAIATGAALVMTYSWDDVAQLLGRSSDVSGRTALWTLAVTLIREHPVFGWGFDDNASVIELTSLPYSHFHNGFLDLAVRGGLCALLVVSVFLVRGIRDLLARTPRDARAVAAFLPLVAAAMVHNATEVSLVAPRNVLWLLLLFVVFWASVSRGVRTVGVPGRSRVRKPDQLLANDTGCAVPNG